MPAARNDTSKIVQTSHQFEKAFCSAFRNETAWNGKGFDVSVPALQERLDFKLLQEEMLAAIGSERGELFRRVVLPGSDEAKKEGKEPHRALITKVAHIKMGRSISPHGHSNMASAFMCISGEFTVRQCDKLEENDDEMNLRQTVDEPAAGVGTWSSISDYRNNNHWLTAKIADCYSLMSKLIGVETGRPLHDRINVDVRDVITLGSATYRAPKISHAEAADRY